MTTPSQPVFYDSPDKAIVDNGLIGQTIEFVWRTLLPWRNDPERPLQEGEEELNGQLHDYLSIRAKEELPMVYFRHEQRQGIRRRIDIAVKPVKTVMINGDRYIPYQPILLIEGKRLPAPSNDRKREYVTGEDGDITGGIQRFKLGKHGKAHDIAIIVGYVQEKSPQDWHPIVNGWILELAESHPNDWKTGEVLANAQGCPSMKRIRSVSEHHRISGCKSDTIQLHHFWIQMN